MVGVHGGVATRIKGQINPFLLSCHCVTHKTNLAALDATKSPQCKVIFDTIDSLLNFISSFFNKSCKCKHVLTALQDQPFDAKRTMKRYHKIRWLSRWQAVTTLCDSLELVLIFFQDFQDGKDLDQAKFVLAKLS